MSSHYPQHEYASPRPSLASPGLTHRGKTPRSAEGYADEGQHTHFQFNESGMDVSTDCDLPSPKSEEGSVVSGLASGAMCDLMSARSPYQPT